MKLSRRSLLKASLGAGALGMLDRFGMLSRPAYALDENAPSRLLSIYVPGGYTLMNMFCPLGASTISAELPDRKTSLGESVFFGPDQVEALGSSDGGDGPIQIVRTWDPANPGSRGNAPDGTRYLPLGYGWREYDLQDQLAVVHGIDHNTVAHTAGHIAAMCGVAGPNYRAPAFQSVVANALSARFPDRPLPCVALDARSVPNSLGLPSLASATQLSTVDRIRSKLSTTDRWWEGLSDREIREASDYFGAPVGDVNSTLLEDYVALTARSVNGPNDATNALLANVHDSLQGVSNLLAQDVVSALEATPGVENLPTNAQYGGSDVAGYNNHFGFTFGLANGSDGGRYNPVFDSALRLMKADLSSSIHCYLPVFNHDTHSATGHETGFLRLRADMDAIARLLGEMKMTQSPSRSDRTLLEDTMVVVFSEFSRTWWRRGDDHWQHTSALFAGGGIGRSRSVGNFTSDNQFAAGGYGVPVNIQEETGSTSSRVPTAADFVSTIYRGMGMEMDDFFIPGGYGEILGVREST